MIVSSTKLEKDLSSFSINTAFEAPVTKAVVHPEISNIEKATAKNL